MTALHNDGQKAAPEGYREPEGDKRTKGDKGNTESAKMKRPHGARGIAFCGMFTAVAIVKPGLLPGMKLGLANCVILFVLMGYGFGSAALVSLVRIIVVNSLFGNMTAVAFSLAGAALSILVMSLLKKSGRFSMVGISLAGGVAHNLGQVLVAMIIFENVGMFCYFPALIVTGIAAGVFVGILAGLVYAKVQKHL